MTIPKEHVLNPRHILYKTTSKYLGLLYQYIYINTNQQGNKIQIKSRHVHNVRHVSDDLSKTQHKPICGHQIKWILPGTLQSKTQTNRLAKTTTNAGNNKNRPTKRAK